MNINLENQLNLTNNKLNELQSLKILISQKDNELNNLKQQLKNMSNVNLNNSNKKMIDPDNLKCINFISNDQKIYYAIPCSGDSIFAEIEEQLYKKFPEYRETNNSFYSKWKTNS